MYGLPIQETIYQLLTVYGILWHMILYIFFGRGLLKTSLTQRAVFPNTKSINAKTMRVQTEGPRRRPAKAFQRGNFADIEIMINPISCIDKTLQGHPFFTFYMTLIQSLSCGFIELISRDPLA